MGTRLTEYPMEQIEWLRKVYPANGLKKTHELFNAKFGYHTESQLKHRLGKFGIKSNNNSKYQKGSKPWNKGMDFKKERPDLYDMYAENMRKHITEGTGCVYKLPVGSESVNSKGYVEIKIAENTWVLKHRYLYEQYHNVKLDNSENVIFLDGNRNNFDKENLYVVSDTIVLRIGKNKGFYKDKDMTLSSIAIAKIKQKIKELENENG